MTAASPESTLDSSAVVGMVDPAASTLCLPAGSRVVIFSDTRLTGRPTESTESTEIIAAQVALCIDSLTGPGAVVLNGDTVDLRECDHDDPAQALTISHSGTARRRVLSAA